MSTSPKAKQSFVIAVPASPSRIAKRKRDGLEALVDTSGKRNRSKNLKGSKSDEDGNLDLDQDLNLSISNLDNRLLADYIAKRTLRFSPDLSPVELEDIYISGNFEYCSFGR